MATITTTILQLLPLPLPLQTLPLLPPLPPLSLTDPFPMTHQEVAESRPGPPSTPFNGLARRWWRPRHGATAEESVQRVTFSFRRRPWGTPFCRRSPRRILLVSVSGDVGHYSGNDNSYYYYYQYGISFAINIIVVIYVCDFFRFLCLSDVLTIFFFSVFTYMFLF